MALVRYRLHCFCVFDQEENNVIFVLFSGHKFANRFGHMKGKSEDEQSPIFLQFLDCVYQLTEQFPTCFEFNEKFLLEVVFHASSLRFGTFLFNSNEERERNNIAAETTSLWAYLNSKKKLDELRNINFKLEENVISLSPVVDKIALKLWLQCYLIGNDEQRKFEERVKVKERYAMEMLKLITHKKEQIMQREIELAKLQEELITLQTNHSEPNLVSM